MLAVLQDAVDTLVKGSTVMDTSRRKLLAATEAWFAAEDHQWPFSLAAICETLDLDAAKVRGWLAALRRERAGVARTVDSVPAPWVLLAALKKRQPSTATWDPCASALVPSGDVSPAAG